MSSRWPSTGTAPPGPSSPLLARRAPSSSPSTAFPVPRRPAASRSGIPTPGRSPSRGTAAPGRWYRSPSQPRELGQLGDLLPLGDRLHRGGFLRQQREPCGAAGRALERQRMDTTERPAAGQLRPRRLPDSDFLRPDGHMHRGRLVLPTSVTAQALAEVWNGTTWSPGKRPRRCRTRSSSRCPAPRPGPAPRPATIPPTEAPAGWPCRWPSTNNGVSAGLAAGPGCHPRLAWMPGPAVNGVGGDSAWRDIPGVSFARNQGYSLPWSSWRLVSLRPVGHRVAEPARRAGRPRGPGPRAPRRAPGSATTPGRRTGGGAEGPRGGPGRAGAAARRAARGGSRPATGS